MRMAFGLVSVLVAIGVIVWIISAVEAPSMQQAANVQKNVRPKVEQIAGKDSATGEDARQSIKLDIQGRNGKMVGVLVTAITPGGAFEKYFGLQRGDVVTQIAPAGGAFMPVADMSTPAEAKDQLLSAYQNSQQIVVMRGEQKLTLPATPTASPAAPAAAPAAGSNDAVQKQLDTIKIPR